MGVKKGCVSIITPVYNSSAYLRRCIDSVLAQGYTNWELLLVNDGSKDNSLEICESYAQQDSRITVFTQNNQGQAVARNVALQHARGEFIAFLDSDDAWRFDVLERSIDALYRNAECDIVQFSVLVDVGHPGERTMFSSDCVRLGTTEQLKALFLERITSLWVWNKVYRREVLNGISFLPGFLYEDNLYSYEVILASRGTVFISDTQYYYHWNSSSTTHAPVQKNYEDMVAIHGRMYEKIAEYTSDKEFLYIPIWMIANDMYSSWKSQKKKTTVMTIGAPYMKKVRIADFLFNTRYHIGQRIKILLVKLWSHLCS